MNGKLGAGCPYRAARERLAALLDGELPPGEAAALGAHVRSCPPCTSELALLRTAKLALRNVLPALIAPPALLGDVRARLDQAAPRRFRHRWLWFFNRMAVLALLGQAQSALD